MIDFRTEPASYRHWRLRTEGRVAFLDMDVDPAGGLDDGYELKLNSYDLGVDIELADAVQRIRFEHPEVAAVVVDSAKERVFCAGANIGMLATAAHSLKVNFCKFTNETRNAIEEASALSGQRYLAAINGTAAGGGYELALATDHIMLIDDGSASVALPEVPLLGVLPGTGGLTRLVDKRHVRRDRADVFCTVEEGIKGKRALEWGLVDELVPGSRFEEVVRERAESMAASTDGPDTASGVALTRLERRIDDTSIRYRHVAVEIDRVARTATITIEGPAEETSAAAVAESGDRAWLLATARELDDAILHLRVNELEIGTFLMRTTGDLDLVAAHDDVMRSGSGEWLMREIGLLWRRVLKRLDVTSRTIISLIEPGSCYAGVLAEIAFASDRIYMFEGRRDASASEARLLMSDSNFGMFPMSNGLSRLATRFWGDDGSLMTATNLVGVSLDAAAALDAGLVTEAMDDIDWDDELRVILEERSSFSPDGLTAMEANLRFPGPETLETKIFGRLTAWQNWVFQRPNASGDSGALRRYGSGIRPDFDKRRV